MQCGGNHLVTDQIAMTIRQRLVFYSERLEVNLPRLIGSVERVQSCFQPQKGDGMTRPNRDTHDPSGVGVQSGRHVNGNDRLGRFVQRVHQRFVALIERALQADAKQSVKPNLPVEIDRYRC